MTFQIKFRLLFNVAGYNMKAITCLLALNLTLIGFHIPLSMIPVHGVSTHIQPDLIDLNKYSLPVFFT